jgi:peptide/nickel transport system permease protein
MPRWRSSIPARPTDMRAFGLTLLAVIVSAALMAPTVAPYPLDRQFGGLLHAPPTVPHLRDDRGRWHAPFIYPWTLTNQLEQRYDEDRSVIVPLRWLSGGALMSSADEGRMPLMLLGADSYGRDVFSRLVYGARLSLAVAVVSAAGALLLGALVGGIAGYAGGLLDDVLMRGSDFVIVLPAMYVALALRSAMKLVLPPFQIFALLTGIFAVVGAPFLARGVRAIVRSEKRLDYATAAASLGAGHARLLLRHLLPAAGGFIGVEITLLIPAFIVAEATLSYVGLGFPDPVASWGTMLHDAFSIRAFADFPWLLSPAAAMFLLVLGLNLVVQHTHVAPVYNAADGSPRRLRADSDTFRS